MQLIHGSGGVQCYVAAKVKWLESHGWHVVVISSCSPKSKRACLLGTLNRFIPYGNVFTSVHPHELPICVVKRQLQKMIGTIGFIEEGEEVIVETWDSSTAMWGELLAKRIRARHLFWTANERYRLPGQRYEEKIEFYKYKMDRGEILTGYPLINYLFEGYYKYKESDVLHFYITEDPIQDVYCASVDTLTKADWNICYIGRDAKPYVPNIIKGIEMFAKNHEDKQIQFIIVGKVSTRRKLLNSIKCPNVSIIELGDLYPLPRQLYQKVDVVIAGSGSARHSVDEGAIVISTDTKTLQSNGILGYDTQSSIYAEGKENEMTFESALERALVLQEWKNQDFIWKKTPGIDDSMAIQDIIVAHATKELNYYDENKLLLGKIKIKALLRAIIMNVIRK